MKDQLTLYGKGFSSRLLLGTARYDSPSLLEDTILAANPAMVTVSLRRQMSGSKESGQSFWNLLRERRRPILPNTANRWQSDEANALHQCSERPKQVKLANALASGLADTVVDIFSKMGAVQVAQ